MKLHNLILKKCVVFIEGDRKKEETIDYLLSILYEHSNLKNEEIKYDEIYKELLKREKEQSTAIGKKFAFPHARLNNLKGTYTLLAVSKKGIDFESLDNDKVNFIILSLVPRLDPGILLKSRAAILSVLTKDSIQNKIMQTKDPEDIWDIIEDEDIDLNKEILAKDIMRPQIGRIHLNMTLYEAARELHRFHVDSLPIIVNNEEFYGVLSCHDLFSYKLPDFFKNLHSISFVKHMNPFEKYFQSDTYITIGDLKLNENPPVIDADATLMEIIFEMTVKNNEFLYVIDDKKLLGTIDRFSIIDKILMSNISGVKS